jgi:hypothetical protein
MDKHFRVRKQVTAAMLYKRLAQSKPRGADDETRVWRSTQAVSVALSICALLAIRKRDDEIGLLLWRAPLAKA